MGIERLFALSGQVWRTTTAFGIARLAVLGLSFGTVVRNGASSGFSMGMPSQN
ncbi:hypothetical protein OG259_05220 [Streptomyces sp. NBC_00250]|uniref:hypothetical protein n=1 Tax=Streptomyces sp. NBC_00250 TaxID=2903641 RepID=UPI002E2C44EA|nr:hypothetical protein [Streptomyces sp. NBC_00250]